KQLFDAFLLARPEAAGTAFEPFDIERDYRRYVDGMPRHDGVRCFLAARAIVLPEGSDGDGPDTPSVHGLAARKNGFFNAWLQDHVVQPHAGTVALIGALRSAGMKTAVFSASCNAEQVLSSAGVLELFDTKVDGGDARRLGLRGKPDPAMLLEAAARLGLAPARCAVVEDASAGVAAGAAGHFGLVIGVDRSDDGDALRDAGASVVVQDLAELALAPDKTLTLKTLASIPSVWSREAVLRQRLTAQRPAVFLDYDGTLSPIVADHTKAFMSAAMRAAVHRLSQHCTVAIVSGRDLAMLQSLVQLDMVFYAGSHGFEIAGPQGSDHNLERGTEFLPLLGAAEQQLREALAGIEGHSVERKRFSIAVHFRGVAEGDQGRLEALVRDVLTAHRRLRLGHGKKVFELQPDIDWHKGHAVRWLLDQLGLERPEVLPIYVGDDITDETAFRALAGRGLGIAVRDGGTRATAADWALDDVAEVQRLLELLSSIAAGG
ncbi:MAG: trehalose-phosphatase, partial [Rubrivivax sp.]|nr:trehalose-phosphatase [Rubrivivax sp.]